MDKRSFCGAVLAMLLAAGTSEALMISTSAVNLYDYLPASTQGTNGIYCQYYNYSAATYTNLSCGGGYYWKTSLAGLIPEIKRQTTSGDIRVSPATVNYGAGNLAAVINVGLEGSGSVRVTGSVSTDNSQTAYFSIYKGQANVGNPIWSGSGADLFNVVIPFVNGEKLFLACSGGTASTSIYGHWSNVQFTLVPEPMSMLMVAMGMLLIKRKR